MSKKYYKTKRSALELFRAVRRHSSYYGCFITLENTPNGFCVFCDYKLITYEDLKPLCEKEENEKTK